MPATKAAVEDRVAAYEEKYRAMADGFADTVWVVDVATMQFLYISPGTVDVRGYTQKETIGQEVVKILKPDSVPRLEALLAEARKEWKDGESRTYTTEIAVWHKNGSTVWLEISAKLVQEADEPPKIVGITRNIDKRKKAEMEKERLLAELQGALEEIKRLESLLPICSGCRRIRHGDDTWWPLEKYVEEKAGSSFTHTICPDCRDIYYPPRKP